MSAAEDMLDAAENAEMLAQAPPLTVGIPAIIEPSTGEVVAGSGVDIDLSDPVAAALALDRVREFESDLAAIKRVLSEAVIAHWRLTGESTLELGGRMKAEVKAGKRSIIDPEILEEGLRAAGMPETRIDALITTTHERKVAAVKAKSAAAANPDYKAALEAATTTYQDTPSVSIRRR